MKTSFLLSVLLTSLLLPTITLADIVHLNSADAETLRTNLKGIGEKKAAAIIAYRQEHGAFTRIDEIMEVKGIGKGIFAKIKADLVLQKPQQTPPANTADTMQPQSKLQDKGKNATVTPVSGSKATASDKSTTQEKLEKQTNRHSQSNKSDKNT